MKAGNEMHIHDAGAINVAHEEIDLKNPRANRTNAGWRIDYFVVSRLEGRMESACIHQEIFGSDHCPVELVIS